MIQISQPIWTIQGMLCIEIENTLYLYKERQAEMENNNSNNNNNNKTSKS